MIDIVNFIIDGCKQIISVRILNDHTFDLISTKKDFFIIICSFGCLLRCDREICEKCYDAIWYQETMNELWDVVVQEGKL